ncbi:3204_t:CDS:1, partial [Acaulospora colombiana]
VLSIIDFLNEYEVEPYDAKIDKYTRILKAIANDQQGERTKKAQSLLDSFMLTSKD